MATGAGWPQSTSPPCRRSRACSGWRSGLPPAPSGSRPAAYDLGPHQPLAGCGFQPAHRLPTESVGGEAILLPTGQVPFHAENAAASAWLGLLPEPAHATGYLEPVAHL